VTPTLEQRITCVFSPGRGWAGESEEKRAKRTQTAADSRANAAQIVADAGATTLDDLHRVPDSGSPSQLFAKVIWLLGRIGDGRSTTPRLRGVLSTHRNPSVRAGAAQAIGFLGGKRALEPLERAVREDPDPWVRESALNVGFLHDVDDARIAAFAGTILRDRAETPAIRGCAAEALGHIHDGDAPQAAVEALREGLEDEHAEVRFWSAFGLFTCGSREDVPALEHLARTDRRVLSHWWSISREPADAIAAICSREIWSILDALEDAEAPQ
jgi:HEAT repeat protein